MLADPILLGFFVAVTISNYRSRWHSFSANPMGGRFSQSAGTTPLTREPLAVAMDASDIEADTFEGSAPPQLPPACPAKRAAPFDVVSEGIQGAIQCFLCSVALVHARCIRRMYSTDFCQSCHAAARARLRQLPPSLARQQGFLFRQNPESWREANLPFIRQR